MTDFKSFPTRMPATDDVAWAAGVFEGEGCVYSKMAGGAPEHRRPYLTATVYQKDPEILGRLRAFFGGNVRLAMRRENPDGCSVWQISGRQARAFLNAIFSRLSARRQTQALLAFKLAGPDRRPI